MKTYPLISAIVAFGFCFFPWGESARAAGDPLAQRQQEMDRLLSRQRLDQIERDQRLDQRSYGDKITQMQQQLNQRPSSPADEIQNHYLLYRLQQDFNQLQLEHRQGYLRRQQEIERLERLQEQRRLGKDPQFEWLRREHRQDHARQRNSLDQLEGEIERLQRQPAR